MKYNRTITIRVSEDVMEIMSFAGINVSKVCREALELLAEEIIESEFIQLNEDKIDQDPRNS